MINSKGIKILCYIIMGFIYVLSFLMILFGIVAMLEDKGSFYGIFVFLGFLLPITVTVSLYPIFALANIDENLDLLNRIARQIVINRNQWSKEQTGSCQIREEACDYVSESESKEETVLYHISDLEKAINYVNLKYQISICVDDSIEEIKTEIAGIADGSFSAELLKSRVAEANTKAEILKIFINHRVLYS